MAGEKLSDEVLKDATRGHRVEHTVFVNAANQPTGSRAKLAHSFGTGPFMPIIVDLLEDVETVRHEEQGADVKMEL